MLPITPNSTTLASITAAIDRPPAVTKSKTADSPDQQKLKKAAGEFEGMLFASLWKSMKHSFADPKDDDSDPAGGTIDDWGIEVMSGAMGKADGLGIAKLILKHLGPDAASQSAQKHPSSTNVFGNLADRNL